jgi:large subunit ribosomal protein L21
LDFDFFSIFALPFWGDFLHKSLAMYAIVDIAGQQFKVEKDQKLFVHRLEGDAGAKVNFDQVLLIDNNGKVSIGSPVLEGAKVSATILEHMKGDKVIVFKKKRRKGYQVANGHRQYMTRILIDKITAKSSSKKAEEKTEETAEK